MRRILFVAAALLMLSPVVMGQATNWQITGRPTSDWFGRPTSDWFTATDTPRNVPLQWMRAVDPMIAAAVGSTSGQVGTGSFFYVDSGVANAGDGTSWNNAVATLDEAINLCTDNNGDVIYVAEGHAEATITTANAWDADVPGVTIIGCGNGDMRPTFTFTGTDGNVAIGDSGVVIRNLRFVAGVSAIDDCINVEAAADDCAIINCEWPEPPTSTFEFIRPILVAAGADRLLVYNCQYTNADATGTTNFIDLDAGVQNGTKIIGNLIHGEFAEGPIHTDDADLEMLIAYNIVTNMTTAQHGIEIAANATGWLIGNIVSTDGIGTSYDIGYMEDGGGNLWDDYGSYDTAAVPWTTNETGVNRWGATELAQIEAEATDALEADHLDHLAAVSVADEIVNQSFLADITSATQDWSTFVAADDSLEAISDKITALEGVNFMMTATGAGAATTFISTDGGDGFGDDYFNTGWSLIITYDAGAVGGAPEGDIRDIVDYVSTTGTFTVAPIWSGAQSTAI
ncbi:MAG: hypothetical protein ACYS74_22295, partial [Planctomycetota bacterium]